MVSHVIRGLSQTSGPIVLFLVWKPAMVKIQIQNVSIVIVGVRVPLNIGADVELMFELLCYFDLYSPIDWI